MPPALLEKLADLFADRRLTRMHGEDGQGGKQQRAEHVV
jgi:hypothetical protein